ncbi:hypothetical protein E2C01_100179 [Portunus trituberculatus]|uniref:Uncharacterized protein n=1 Tax=Portunus trituberculatus TaxID=210409 RepID=A0A5B7KCV6_PORTR|nr:hypothetical protein [Portunus trituberculatus]
MTFILFFVRRLYLLFFAHHILYYHFLPPSLSPGWTSHTSLSFLSLFASISSSSFHKSLSAPSRPLAVCTKPEY